MVPQKQDDPLWEQQFSLITINFDSLIPNQIWNKAVFKSMVYDVNFSIKNVKNTNGNLAF